MASAASPSIARRPQCVTFRMYEQLQRLPTGENDSSVKVLLLTGAGEKAFARAPTSPSSSLFPTPEDALNYESRIERVLTALEKSRLPTIARLPECALAAVSRLPVAATFA